ncbi:MAG: thiamine pyrophosphate-binding protein [Ketobacteraceae bacterium]|nr:thiamine pyrophosphate-binding protein [Ketobacteraceae bacterium]
MKKTGAWLVRYGLEQVGVRYTFGIPGVHNTEIYDELNSSEQIQPILVTHEAGGAFMADAMSRVSDTVGALVIVPAAGAAYASAGIGEAFLDGVPMLVISGGTRTDVPYRYQLHEMDQLAMMAAITKRTYRIENHSQIVPTIFEAYQTATQGEPGPVFIEVPVNIQLFSGEVTGLPEFTRRAPSVDVDLNKIRDAADLLCKAKKPGLFLGWGARDCSDLTRQIAEFLNAPVATTLQGLSVFPASHPLHTGMSFGGASVPAAENAFRDCDCLLAVGTRFGEIATGSFGVKVPENLIHVDINPKVLQANYPAKVAIESDARVAMNALVSELKNRERPKNQRNDISIQIGRDKSDYFSEWAAHDSGERVNPYLLFKALREQMADDDIMVVDDGNHTFLAAELMPVHKSRHFISPTDFNCMGYCVPGVIAAKLAHPDKQVVGIVGDGAFTMTCMEIITAKTHELGGVFFVFHDGELSQISQAQEIPYNRKTCTVIGNLDVSGVARATGARFLALESNADIDDVVRRALEFGAAKTPVVVDVSIDYSKRTRFTEGIVATNLKRFNLPTKARFISRAIKRKITG